MTAGKITGHRPAIWTPGIYKVGVPVFADANNALHLGRKPDEHPAESDHSASAVRRISRRHARDNRWNRIDSTLTEKTLAIRIPSSRPVTPRPAHSARAAPSGIMMP